MTDAPKKYFIRFSKTEDFDALSDFYDAVPMKALVLAQRDAAGGKLSQEKQLEIRDTMEDVVDAMKEYDDKSPVAETVLADEAGEE